MNESLKSRTAIKLL